MTFPNEVLKDILLSTAAFAASRQLENGAMPGGRNGPHQHFMTGARETAHWAIFFAYCSEVLGVTQYRENAIRAYDALTSKLFLPLGGAYWHRKEDGKSSYNGLIGQAWTLESLYYGYRVLKKMDLHDAGVSLIRNYTFDHSLGLWYEADLDGSRRAICGTLNQQIWFMAWVVMFSQESEGNGIRFLDCLEGNSTIRKCGLFYTGIHHKSALRRIYARASQIRRSGLSADPRFDIDCGYHLFTLLGLAFLYGKFPGHHYFSSSQFENALNYAFTKQYEIALLKSEFGYQYNVPGLEYPFLFSVFGDRLPEGSFKSVLCAFRHQLLAHLNTECFLLNQNSVDPLTLMARTYEFYRIPLEILPNLQIDELRVGGKECSAR